MSSSPSEKLSPWRCSRYTSSHTAGVSGAGPDVCAGGKWPPMGALRWPAAVGVKWECWLKANTEAVPERGWCSGEGWGPKFLGKAAQKLDPRAGPTGCQAVTRPWSRVRFSKDDRLEGNEGRHASVNLSAGGFRRWRSWLAGAPLC